MREDKTKPPRLLLPDAARGLAIWGILICNAPAFAPDASPPPQPFVHILFEHRFLALLAMLFGASIVMIGGHRSAAGRDARLYRRLGWLGVIGLAHGALLWWGDILLSYAFTGLITMQCRSWPAPRLILTGAMAFALLVALSAIESPDMAATAPTFANNSDHSWSNMSASLPASLLTLAPLMLIGMGFQKIGLFAGTASPGRYRMLVAMGGLALLCAMLPLPWGGAIGWASAPLIATGYLALFALAARSRWSCVPRAFAPAGRMALTNYLLQSVVMTLVFASGFRPAPLMLMGLATAIGILQLILSALWLSHFDTGPAEHVWRRLYQIPLHHG